MRREIAISVLLIIGSISIIFTGGSEGTEESTEDRISISSDWEGPPLIRDRDGEIEFNLTGPEGMFNDSIGKIYSIMIFNEYINGWQSFIDMDFFNLNIIRIEDRWIASVEVQKFVGGNCIITLKVENSTMADEVLLEINVTVENSPPEKPDRFYIYPDPSRDLNVGDEIEFFVSSVKDPDNDKLTYFWDFGDGATTTGMNVTHTYSKKGFKSVSMWVSDGDFETEKIYQRIEILDEHPYINDRDYDYVEDSLDAFPDDWAASVDTDGDGYPNRWNDRRDMDDSRTGLKLDNYPEDPERNGYEEKGDLGEKIIMILILCSLVVIALLIATMIAVILKDKFHYKDLQKNDA